MARCQITSETVNLDITFTPSADFITCLIPALLAALPAFINALMSCLAGQPPTGTYNPGTRLRCH